MPEAADPGAQGAVAGIDDQAVAVDDPDSALTQLQIQPRPVQGAAARRGQPATCCHLAVPAHQIEPPASGGEGAQAGEDLGIAFDRIRGLQPILEEITEDHQPRRRQAGEPVEELRERAVARAQMDVADDVDRGQVAAGRRRGGGGHRWAALVAAAAVNQADAAGFPAGSWRYPAPPMAQSPGPVPDALPGAVLRLHGAWDTPAGRAWCASLPGLVANAPEAAVIYRGRNVLVRLDGPTGPVVVKAFGRGKWWRTRQGLGKAGESYDHGTRALRLGVATPEPRAVILARGTGGFYVCDWIPGCRSVWDLHDGLLPASGFAPLAEFVARMHEAGVHHADLTPGNVLLQPVGDGFAHLLVDLNRMRFAPVSLRTGLAALAKLECAGHLVAPYAAARGADPVAAQRIYARVTLLERTSRRLKDATRPLRRKLGL